MAARASCFGSVLEKMVHVSCELVQNDLLHVFRHDHKGTGCAHLLQLEHDADLEGVTRGLKPCCCIDDQVAVGELVGAIQFADRRTVNNDIERHLDVVRAEWYGHLQ